MPPVCGQVELVGKCRHQRALSDSTGSDAPESLDRESIAGAGLRVPSPKQRKLFNDKKSYADFN
jgi:hypothetical protein